MRRSRDGGEEAQSEKQENVGDFFAREPSEHEFVAGVVCFSFDPKKRERKNLSQLHKPVPNYEEKIEMATRRVFDNLLRKMDEDGGQPLFRANWAIQNSSDLISTDLDWHPTEHVNHATISAITAGKTAVRNATRVSEWPVMSALLVTTH